MHLELNANTQSLKDVRNAYPQSYHIEKQTEIAIFPDGSIKNGLVCQLYN